MPALSREAAAVLQRFFLTLRREHMTPDSTPITTRQLESVIRLAEARAKLELRELVTAQDAADVVELMRESLVEAATDEFGTVDFSRSAMSNGKSVLKFVSKLQAAARQRGSSLFTQDELTTFAAAMQHELKVASVAELIEVGMDCVLFELWRRFTLCHSSLAYARMHLMWLQRLNEHGYLKIQYVDKKRCFKLSSAPV